MWFCLVGGGASRSGAASASAFLILAREAHVNGAVNETMEDVEGATLGAVVFMNAFVQHVAILCGEGYLCKYSIIDTTHMETLL